MLSYHISCLWRLFLLAVEDMVKTSKLVERYGMDWHDYVNVVLMKKYEAEEVYSNDSHFDKVDGIGRICSPSSSSPRRLFPMLVIDDEYFDALLWCQDDYSCLWSFLMVMKNASQMLNGMNAIF